ncbi:MAG: WecB/TagA/CpsF family glycosyltransferase [Ignavibacteriales bacterium]|nr:WecB/TagA/CpsF family glycosyltransferase [Ignavibacteriales bacterium]
MRHILNDIKISTGSKILVFEEVEKLLERTNNSLIITFNLDFLRISTQNLIFKDICTKADIVVPDGIGVTSLLRMIYNIKVNRITGNDIFQFLLNLSRSDHLRYAFIGSEEKVLRKLESYIDDEFPYLKEKLFFSPQYKFEESKIENEKLVNTLVRFKPDILFLALGCPRQEIWLYEHMNKIGAKINIGIGATFDFYTGFKKRSPIFFQELGFEWLWRLMSEPKRLFRRYVIVDIPFYFKSVIKIYTSNIHQIFKSKNCN